MCDYIEVWLNCLKFNNLSMQIYISNKEQTNYANNTEYRVCKRDIMIDFRSFEIQIFFNFYILFAD